MSIPEVFFRETIDLNRYSNSVAKKYAVTYNEIIVNAAKQLKQIDLRQQAADAGVVIAPQTRKRLRAIIKQSKDSLATWSTKSAIDFKKELQGVTILQKDFIENELKKVTASGDVPINSVAISPKYAESVIMTDPSKVNIFTSKAFTEDNFVNFGSGKFSLTATQGAAIRLPNGTTVSKAFRGLAESSAERLDLAVRSGVFAGESLDQITRRLVGRLEFADFGPLSVKQLALAGGELTKVANNQISTIVRTSVNQVTNQASQAVYAANKKVAPKYEYVATLDSRTSPICQRLDGQIFDYNKGPTPPQHFNCRSTTVPVVDFDRLQKDYPSLEKPPATKLDTRPSITGRVPQGTPYGNWLLQQDRKLQVKTLGNEGKVRIFKKLAKKEGSGQAALRKMIRNDGSEVSLARLEQLYGKPRDITTITRTPKPVAKPVGFERRLVDSSPDQLRKDGKALMDEVGGLDVAKLKKLKEELRVAAINTSTNIRPELQDGLIAKFEKAKNAYTEYNFDFSRNLEKLRNKMLETSLTDAQVSKLVNNVDISRSFSAAQKGQIQDYFTEYVKMFNGAGFVESANGVPAVNSIGKARRASCAFYRGTFTTSTDYRGRISKSTTFHEITHVVEVQNPKLNTYTNKWKFDRAFGDVGAKKITDKKILEKYLDKPTARPNKAMTTQLEKPVYQLKSITDINYRKEELAFVNDYKNSYMGKVYDMYDYSKYGDFKNKINPSEVLTMSVETFSSPENMQTLIVKHPDLFELVVGMSRAGNL
jgi:SPP1 gp7 family putative phage head morphogenesis protein